MDETEIPLTPDTPILTVHVDNSVPDITESDEDRLLRRNSDEDSNESVDDSLIDKSPDTAQNLVPGEHDEDVEDKNQPSVYCVQTNTEKQKSNMNETPSKNVFFDEMPLEINQPISSFKRTGKRTNTTHQDSIVRSIGEFVNILLIGKAGSGKSTAGNIISGNVAFDVSPIAQLVTTECQEENIRINDVQVKLVDTPGFFNLKFENSIVQEKLGEYLKTHRHMFPLIFVLCIQNGVRFTKEDEDVIKYIEENFGSRVFQNLIVVFTGTGSMIYNNKDTHKEDLPKWFEKLQQRVEQRTFYFQNDTSENDNKVALFLATCQKLLKNTVNLKYNFSDYEEAQRRIEERKNVCKIRRLQPIHNKSYASSLSLSRSIRDRKRKNKNRSMHMSKKNMQFVSS